MQQKHCNMYAKSKRLSNKKQTRHKHDTLDALSLTFSECDYWEYCVKT